MSSIEKMYNENICLMIMVGALIVLIAVYFLVVKKKMKNGLVPPDPTLKMSGRYGIGPGDGYKIIPGGKFNNEDKANCYKCLDPNIHPQGATYSNIGGCVTNPEELGGYTVEYGKPVANSFPIGKKFGCDKPGIAVLPNN